MEVLLSLDETLSHSDRWGTAAFFFLSIGTLSFKKIVKDVWKTDLQFQLSFYPHSSVKEPYCLSSYIFSPAVFRVFALSKIFLQLAVPFMYSLRSTEFLDKEGVSLIFFFPDHRKGCLMFGTEGKKNVC